MNLIKGLSERTRWELAEMLAKVTEEVYQSGFEAGKKDRFHIGVDMAKGEDFTAVNKSPRDEARPHAAFLAQMAKLGKVTPFKSPNQQRAELIQRAREFVEEHEKSKNAEAIRSYGNKYCRNHFYESDFITKNNKVTVLIHLTNYRGHRLKTVAAVGRSKCMPGEVFNEWIGKAISLARALEIEIPQEFLRAVQPTEKVIGMRVLSDLDDIRTIVANRDYKTTPESCMLGSYCGVYSTIIDDTNAIYGELAV